MKIHISRVHFPVTTLGPGQRVGIWMQGCSIQCAGCISADTWAFGSGAIDVATLLQDVSRWLSGCDGVTISGGEPFDQPDALFDLLSILKRDHDTNILVFSGYPLEALRPSLGKCAGLIDALVSDPYDQTASQRLALRGSDNQRLTLLTQRGRELFAEYERPAHAHEQYLDAMFDADGVTWMAGIPKGNAFVRLEAVMGEAGHKTQTSRSKRVQE